MRDKSINIINLLLEIVYCNTTLANHDMIKLMRGEGYGMSFLLIYI
jgi:hypothetical protein